jgi:hypothetical protein
VETNRRTTTIRERIRHVRLAGKPRPARQLPKCCDERFRGGLEPRINGGGDCGSILISNTMWAHAALAAVEAALSVDVRRSRQRDVMRRRKFFT